MEWPTAYHTEVRNLSIITRFFGFTEADERLRSLVSRLSVLMLVVAATTQLTTTFFMVSIAEALGGGSIIAGMTMIGLLIVIQMAVQTALDYPSGSVGDYIGQRYILAVGFLCFSSAVFMVSTVTPDTPFWVFVMIYILTGAGASQMSGAFNAWFDNNYRVAAPHDKDRKQYGVFWGKIGMFFSLVGTLALIPGSVLATVFTRPFVFRLEATLYIILAFVTIRAVKDLPEVEAARGKNRKSIREYAGFLREGISYILSNKYVAFVVLGQTLGYSVGIIWGELFLFPMYYSYLNGDVAVSAFRTILFIVSVVQAERASVWSKKFDAETWLPRSLLLGGTGFVFFFAFASIMFVFPPAESAEMIRVLFPLTSFVLLELPASSLIPIVFITLTFTATGFLGVLASILGQRVLLDVIPDRIRNSVYSLSPALATTIAIPQLAICGWLVPNFGFPLAMALTGIISLFGALLVRRGLSYPKPTVTLEPEPSVAVAGAALVE